MTKNSTNTENSTPEIDEKKLKKQLKKMKDLKVQNFDLKI